MDGAVFEIRAAEQAWLSLAAEYSERSQSTISAWKRLTHYYKGLYGFHLDKGFLRLIALFGEKRAEPFDSSSYVFHIGAEDLRITAEAGAAEPNARYVLLRAADIVMRDDDLRAAIRDYVDSTHQSGSYSTETDFALLDSELEDELRLAQENGDGPQKERLLLLAEMLRRLPQLESYHE